MRRFPVAFALVAAAIAVGCAQTPTPTTRPTPTFLLPSSTPSGPASCSLAPFSFSEVTVPAITDVDRYHGSDEAEIVIIEYNDFL